MDPTTPCTAFHGARRIATGELSQVALAVKAALDRDGIGAVLIFDDATSRPIEVDFRGTAADVLARLVPPAAVAETPQAERGPGRPRLGVVAREVTLLPRHWEWLSTQPGGASVALRKLVEEARRANVDQDRVRVAQESCYRFMSALAGNLPGFEEAARALFASDAPRFGAQIASWPADVRAHTAKLAASAFQRGG
jgi:hypothetical protein